MISAWTRNHSYLLICIASCAITTAVIANAFIQKRQFFPAVVFITKSNASMAAIYFQGLTFVFMAWKLVRLIFFGQLRPAEVEHLVEKSWFALTETCLAFTVFRDDFSSHFVALFTVLLFLKCFHWLAEDRVDFMERTPVISRLFHIRIIGLLFMLGFFDLFFTAFAYHSLVTKGVSVQLVFGFEYAILCTVVVFITIKYALHCIDLANDQTPWDRKSAVLLYSELIINFIKLVLYITFLMLMIHGHHVPLFAIRPMYMAVKSFKKALDGVILSRKAIHLMNTLYPNATLEDIRSGDTTCIICREEMVSGCKKLPCNHIFHTHCLRSWFQRQQTCPTCRLNILEGFRRPQPGQAQPAPPALQPQGNIPQQGVPGAAPQQQPPLGAQFPFMFGPRPPMPGFVPMFHAPPPQPAGPGPQATEQPAAPAGPPPTFPPPPFLPPWFSMPMPVPPMPVPTFAELSDADLARLEGDHRRALEMRVAHLRNIQALLDAAVIQFTQYISLIPPAPVPSSFSSPSTRNEPSTSTQQNPRQENSTWTDNERTSSSSAETQTNSQQSSVNSSNTSVSSQASAGTESEEVRRRRLNRFS